MKQAIAAEHLPSVVTNIRPPAIWSSTATNRGNRSSRPRARPVLRRGRRDAGQGRRHLHARPPGRTGTVVEIDGEVEVKIPFLGGKIEGLIVEQLVELFDAEQEFTAGWLGRSDS